MNRRTFPLGILVLLASAAFVCALCETAAETAAPEPQQRRARPARRGSRRQARPRVDYSSFSHRTPQHRQRSCDSCHQSPTDNWARVRERGEAFPDVTDYPEHASCLDCHRRQFFSGARPVICSVCHTVVSPRADARHPFQNPEELFARATRKRQRPSEFTSNFPHDRHQDVMARALPGEDDRPRAVGFLRASFARQQQPAAARAVDSCTVCHRTYQPQSGDADEYPVPPPADLGQNQISIANFWLKKGMVKTTPESHAACFSCHWQEGGERPLSSDCAGCHTLAPPAAAGVAGASAAALTASAARADADPSHPSVKGITDAAVLEDWSGRRVARFKHQQETHLKVGCTSCHVRITSVSRLGPDTLDVPVQTCASSNCHGARTGIKSILFQEVTLRRKPEGVNYQCSKCHLNYGREPTPKSHSDLFPPK
jgi:hypothetical protein